MISVENLSFDSAPDTGESIADRALNTAQSLDLPRYGAALIGLLALILLVIRPVTRSLRSAALPAPGGLLSVTDALPEEIAQALPRPEKHAAKRSSRGSPPAWPQIPLNLPGCCTCGWRATKSGRRIKDAYAGSDHNTTNAASGRPCRPAGSERAGNLSGRRRAAILLMALGDDMARQLLQDLPDPMIESDCGGDCVARSCRPGADDQRAGRF